MSKIRILLGGSPCTFWSISQKNNREVEAKGLGWELFKNFLIAKKKFKPDYFLYENNKSAAQAIKDQIKREFNVYDGTMLMKDSGARYIEINSALVSAQSRQRFYVHNVQGVKQPDDREILLKDILESGLDLTQNEKAYALTASYNGAVAWNTIERKQRNMVAEPVIFQRPRGKNKGGIKYDKSPTLTANGSWEQNNKVIQPIRIGTIESGERSFLSDSQANRVYSPYGKSVTINSGGGGGGGKTGLYAVPINATIDGKVKPIYLVENGQIAINGKQYPIKLPDGYYIIRKLTVNECRRLQTIPEWYKMPCSNSQNYKMLGNGWTVEVIKHILQNIPNLWNEPIEVLSMYDGMSCGQIALKELGGNVVKYKSYEIDKYAIETTQANFADTIQCGDAFQVRNENWGY